MNIINHDIIVQHHILPRSRKKNKKTVELERTFHDAWHIVFRNMKLDECKLFIDIVMRDDGSVWTRKQLQRLRSSIMKGGINEITTREKDRWKMSNHMLQKENFYEKS